MLVVCVPGAAIGIDDDDNDDDICQRFASSGDRSSIWHQINIEDSLLNEIDAVLFFLQVNIW